MKRGRIPCRVLVVLGAGVLLIAACARGVAHGPASARPVSTTEQTRTVAREFLRVLFVENDPARAYARFADPDFVQHNPRMADGVAGHRAYFAALERQGGSTAHWANVNNLLLVDGDLFALHHLAFTGPDDPGRAFVDIWRVARGRIVEHWDVIQSIPPVMAHANGMGCGKGDTFAEAAALPRDTIAAPICGLPDPRAARAQSLATLADYSRALFAGDVRAAIVRWFSDDYRQHSPAIADGKDGAIAFLLGEFGKGAAAMPRFGPMRTIAEGDLVLMHRLTTYADGVQTANVDIFRVTAGRISEHWDLKQDIPKDAANPHGMW